MANEYQSDIDDCKTWKVELLDYANSLRDIIRAVDGKTVEEFGDEAVNAAEDLAKADSKSNNDYPDDKREALKQLRETYLFAVNLLDVIDTARKNGWYRIELGYLKVNENGVVLDGRIANTKAIASKTGERAWKLTSYSQSVS
jgi:hypothetical protein